jgi:hypothetical protein
MQAIPSNAWRNISLSREQPYTVEAPSGHVYNSLKLTWSPATVNCCATMWKWNKVSRGYSPPVSMLSISCSAVMVGSRLSKSEMSEHVLKHTSCVARRVSMLTVAASSC